LEKTFVADILGLVMMSKLVEYAQAVLDQMIKTADGNNPPVWTGNMTQLINELAPISYYGAITKKLKDAGAIVQTKRGGGGSPSQWAITDPDAGLMEITGSPRTQGLVRKRTLEGRVEVLERLVGNVDVAKMFADHMKDGH